MIMPFLGSGFFFLLPFLVGVFIVLNSLSHLELRNSTLDGWDKNGVDNDKAVMVRPISCMLGNKENDAQSNKKHIFCTKETRR